MHRSQSGGAFTSGRRSGHNQTGRTQGNGFSQRGRSGGRFAPNTRGRGRGKKRGESIDVSRFINKAGPIEAEVPYEPTHTFSDFQIEDRLKKSIVARGYVNPSPIQDQSVPIALTGRDLIGLANTGTGKTAAFLIPLINKMLLDSKQKALIIAPTRELAIQIQKECAAFTHGLGIYGALAVGGEPIRFQISDIRRGFRFLIGTPGRLKDLIDRRVFDPSQIQNIVLDEADRMLDMGFIDDITQILSYMPAERQGMFFSATFPPAIEKLVHRFLKDPARVMVKTRDTSKNVDQDIIRVRSEEDKIHILSQLLKKKEFDKVVIFSETKYAVEQLAEDLQNLGFRADAIHGDREHRQRQRTLHAFKENRISILVATDVAARGLDIPNVSHVINFEIPQTYDTYVHRIGRTGRAGNRGHALTFVKG